MEMGTQRQGLPWALLNAALQHDAGALVRCARALARADRLARRRAARPSSCPASCASLPAVGSTTPTDGLLTASPHALFASMSGSALARRGVARDDSPDRQQPTTPAAPHFPTALREDTIRQLFDELDRNGDGEIEPDEFKQLLSSLGLPTNSMYLGDLTQQFQTSAAPARGVTFDRFQSYVNRQSAKLRHAFAALDVDGTGLLTRSSLVSAMHAMGLPVDDRDAQRMIHLLDASQDDSVSFDEFCRFACLLLAAQINNGNVASCWVDSADYLEGVEYRLCMTPPRQTIRRLLAGGVAGVVSRTMVAPLERLRTIMMASCPPLTMRESVAAMWADGGARGLLKGNMATVAKVLPASAMQFAVYDGVKDALSAAVPRGLGEPLAGWERLLAGCVAGVSASVITFPLETVRTLVSMPGGGLHGNFWQVGRQVLKLRGLAGLYHGYSSAVMNEALGTGLGFLAYETGQQAWERWRGTKPNARQKGLIGALAAMVVMTATMPLELIMRRMQVAGAAARGGAFQYTGTLHAMRQIIHQEGFAAFYRGSLFAYAKVVPSIACMYALYDVMNRSLAIGGLRRYSQDLDVLLQRRLACEARQHAYAVCETAPLATKV